MMLYIDIDSIGVPRGVSDKFEVRNSIAAGFESLFWWLTINSNVDWINYISYKQQKRESKLQSIWEYIKLLHQVSIDRYLDSPNCGKNLLVGYRILHG